jgi:hypothetical protein
MMKKEKTVWDRIHDQCKPDGKGRFKTIDVIEIAKQIDQERRMLKAEIEILKAALRRNKLI